MSSILKGIVDEGGKRTIQAIARDIVSYLGGHNTDDNILDAVKHESDINDVDPAELFNAVWEMLYPGQVNENLHKWFKEKWVRFGPDGKIRGACARGSDSEGKPKCLPQKKAQSLGKKGRKYAASKKRREDPNPDRHGPAKNVATKKKSNESLEETAYERDLQDNEPRYVHGVYGVKSKEFKKKFSNQAAQDRFFDHPDREGNYEIHYVDRVNEEVVDENCWKGYHKEGNKELFGKTVPNCVKNESEELEEKWSEKYKRSIDCSHPKGFSQRAHCAGRKKNEDIHEAEQCPECGGDMYPDTMLNEKQDACYYKVKSRYKVWPSAYASGALVQCRKKGAKNWGTKSESVEVDEAYMSDANYRKQAGYLHGKRGLPATARDEPYQAGYAIGVQARNKNNTISNEGKYSIDSTSILDYNRGYSDGKNEIPRKNYQSKYYVFGYYDGLADVAKKRSPEIFYLGYEDGKDNNFPTMKNNKDYVIGYNSGRIYATSKEHDHMRKSYRTKKSTHYIESAEMEEAANPAQQAAIAINMKKHHQKPKNETAELPKDKDYDEQVGFMHGKKGIPPVDQQNKAYMAGFIKGLGIHVIRMDNKMSSKKDTPSDVAEDYTGVESGSSAGPFTAERTPAINPYGGEKDRRYRGAIGEGIYSGTKAPLIFNTKILETYQDIREHAIEFFEAYGIEKHHQTYVANIREMLKNKGRLTESSDYREIQPFIRAIDKVSSKSDIKVGDMFAAIMFDIKYMHNEIDVVGFTIPKEVVKIKMSNNGTIDYIMFSDGDRYPRVPHASGKDGSAIEYPAYFDTQAEAEKALTYLTLTLPETWKMDTSAVNNSNTINEMPDTSGPVGVQPGGWRTYSPKPAGTEVTEEESLKSNNPVGIPEDEEYIRMKKVNGKFVRLRPDERYDGKIYYFKKTAAGALYSVSSPFITAIKKESSVMKGLMREAENIKKPSEKEILQLAYDWFAAASKEKAEEKLYTMGFTPKLDWANKNIVLTNRTGKSVNLSIDDCIRNTGWATELTPTAESATRKGLMREAEELDIKFKTISPKDKLVYLAGEKIGMVSKGGERFAGFNEYKKHNDWTGQIKVDGKTVDIGRTQQVSELKPKIARLIRSARIAADNPPVEEDTSYATGGGQGGNAGQSYRKFKPKMAGTFEESAIMSGLKKKPNPAPALTFRQKTFETLWDYNRFHMIPKEETDKKYSSRYYVMNKYAGLFEDSSKSKEAKKFAEIVMQLDERSQVKIEVGSKISILHTTTMPDINTIEIYGFVKPKTIANIHLDTDGQIDLLEFDDGDTYPERGEQVIVNGIRIINTIMFPNEDAASNAYSKLWFAASKMEGFGWKIRTSLSESALKETTSTGTSAGSAGVGGGAMVGGPTTYEQEYGMFKRKGARRITAMTYEDTELDEALDSQPYKYNEHIVGDDRMYDFFTDDGEKYEVLIETTPTHSIAVTFSVTNEYGNPDTRIQSQKGRPAEDPRKVFATVITIVKDFADEMKPPSIYFSAAEPSRMRLYDAFMKRLDRAMPKYEFVPDTNKQPKRYKSYVLRRKTTQ